MNLSAYTPRLREAFRFAERAHHGQIRKGTDGSPYILHPIAVAMVLASAGAADDLLVAGLLHDVVEDTSGAGRDRRRRRCEGELALGARVH